MNDSQTETIIATGGEIRHQIIDSKAGTLSVGTENPNKVIKKRYYLPESVRSGFTITKQFLIAVAGGEKVKIENPNAEINARKGEKVGGSNVGKRLQRVFQGNEIPRR